MRLKPCGKEDGSYLFNHKALAKVFKGKLLDAIKAAGLSALPGSPGKWPQSCHPSPASRPASPPLLRYATHRTRALADDCRAQARTWQRRRGQNC